MEEKTYTCIRCPRGCSVTATIENGEVISVTGNACPRGEQYVRMELTDPHRTVTSIVRVSGGKATVVSVKTATEIPKGKIMECVHELKKVEVKAPVEIGQVLVENIAGTGCNIIATTSVEAE